MGKSLIVVESPAKVKTISKIVQDISKSDIDVVSSMGMQVTSSMGHVRDLPTKELGIDKENGFKPRYVTIRGKGKIVKQLKEAAKNADTIYLATDPDREGEAIAWHVAHVMGKKKDNYKRVLFNEITPKAIRESLEDTTALDMNKIDAQQARRVLDRLVGYEISPLLWKVITSGLSAGRVQSPALRMICERDVEIESFQPRKYWTIELLLARRETLPFRARLHQHNGKKIEIDNQEDADNIVADLEKQQFVVSDVKMRDQSRRPSPPFITSTLQQECARRMRYSVKQTMALAQQLYEGIEIDGETSGLITYMRTDSVRVSDEAIAEVRSLIREEHGSEYLPEKENTYKAKGGAQDAHEAIRPTSVSRHPDKIKHLLEERQWRLYELIWKRFVASQMKPQVLSITTVNVTAGSYVLRATGNIVKFDGFTVLYEASDTENTTWLVSSGSINVGDLSVDIVGGSVEPKKGDLFVVEGDTQHYTVNSFNDGELKFTPGAKISWADNASLTVPFDGTIPEDIADGQELLLSELRSQEHETKPPARYTEASLVKELEAQGIGRPSTYAQIITTLIDREYIERVSRSLKSTELGQTVNKLLVKTFPQLLDVGFTADMEDKLDRIADGRENWSTTVGALYDMWKDDLQEANDRRKELKKALQEESDIECAECGNMLVVKWGRNGRFLACPGYPDCKFTKPLEESEQIDTDETCVECASRGITNSMVVKSGRFGRFLACSAYPDCKSTSSFYIGVSCPEDQCEGRLVEKQSRKKKLFFGCDQYPSCKFASWDKPINRSCQQCGAPILYEKSVSSDTVTMVCSICQTQVKEPVNNQQAA